MALMTPTRLTMAAHNCRDILKQLADKLSSPADFMSAVERYDADEVNDLLEDAVRRCLDTDSLSYGLEQYCRKFGITDDLSKQDDIDRILLIDRYREKIDQQLKNAGV